MVPQIANGRFTATQAPAAAHRRRNPRSGSRPRNRPATKGMMNSAGYSLAAAPSPSSTPDQPSRLRRYARVAAVVIATVSRSQLLVAARASVGASATYRARRPTMMWRQKAIQNAASHIRTAFAKKKRVLLGPDAHAASRIVYIVSTGYSSQVLSSATPWHGSR